MIGGLWLKHRKLSLSLHSLHMVVIGQANDVVSTEPHSKGLVWTEDRMRVSKVLRA